MERRGNLSSLLLRWMSLVVFSKNSVRIIGDLMQSWQDMHGRLTDPPCLVSMCLVNPLHIFPSRPLLLRALISCLPIHVRYAFFSEKTYVWNIYCSSCVTTLDKYFGSPHIVLCRAIILLSSFLMSGSECGTA